MLILFRFRSIFISLPLSTVCEEREFTFSTVRLALMLDMLSKYSYSLYIGTLQVRHWSVAYYRPWRIMLEKVADSAFFAPKLAELYKPYGGQFLEFCSISLSTYQTCMKLTRKSTEFCQFFCRHYPPRPSILSLAVPNLEGKVQVPIDRVCKINSDIRGNLYCGEVQ